MHCPRGLPRPLPACELSLINAMSNSNFNMFSLHMTYEASNRRDTFTYFSSPGYLFPHHQIYKPSRPLLFTESIYILINIKASVSISIFTTSNTQPSIMHPPSGFTSLVAFLALLTKAAADNSAPFELISHVLNPPDPTLDGLYLTAFSYHPGGFFFGTLAEPSDSNPALVSVLTGTAAQLAAGNGTIEISNVDGTDSVYFQIAPGDATAPSVYDSVQLVPGEATTFGLQFVGDVLNYQDVEGSFYGKFSVTLRSL